MGNGLTQVLGTCRRTCLREVAGTLSRKGGNMGLADKIEQINATANGNKCVYQAMIDAMPKEEQEALQAAWDKGYSQRLILRALRSEGYKTSNEAILGHRSGSCKCPKN